MKNVAFVMGVVFATMIPAGARAQGGANPISAAIQSQWATVRAYIQRSAEQMPEANFGFRPVDTVRTFGQVLAHVAGANYEFCAAAKGETSPHGEGDFEKTATVLTMNVGHMNEHYGNLVTYFRIRGIVPPSSQPQ
jgi:DinB superfamily